MCTKWKYVGILFFFLLSCQREEGDMESFDLGLPSHFPRPNYDLSKNPVTKSGFELGKKLFFDSRLSVNGQISCGDCHQQYAGFAHADHKVSHGIFDREGHRNALHLVNLIYQKDFFWDGGVNHMDAISIRPITDTLEMGNTMSQVMQTLNELPEYRAAFRKAFPQQGDTITSYMFFKALSQFMAALVSADSPYDRYVLGEKQALSVPAQKGLELFRLKCATCHSEPLFTDHTFRSNGLANVHDWGRADVTQNDKDRHHFKVPSLRNLTLTSPYMHDGRFQTIEEVLDFYSEGVVKEDHVDPILKNLPEGGFRFSREEKAQLKAFLYSLTDKNFANDKRFYP